MTLLSRRTLKIPEFAQYIGVSVSKAYRMADSGEIAVLQIGGSRRILWSDAEEYLDGVAKQAQERANRLRANRRRR